MNSRKFGLNGILLAMMLVSALAYAEPDQYKLLAPPIFKDYVEKTKDINLEKGQFETTAELESRIAALGNHLIAADMALVEEIPPHIGNYTYNADTETLTLSPYAYGFEATNWGKTQAARVEYAYLCPHEENTKTSSIGQNAYGAKLEILVKSVKKWCMGFVNLKHEPNGHLFKKEIPIPRAEAKQSMPDLRLRIFARVVTLPKAKSRIAVDDAHVSAKVSSPVEYNLTTNVLSTEAKTFQLVNVRTGTVLATVDMP